MNTRKVYTSIGKEKKDKILISANVYRLRNGILSDVYARKLEKSLEFSTQEYPKRLLELESLRRIISRKQQTLNALVIELAFLKEKLKTLSDRVDGS